MVVVESLKWVPSPGPRAIVFRHFDRDTAWAERRNRVGTSRYRSDYVSRVHSHVTGIVPHSSETLVPFGSKFAQSSAL